VGGVGWGSRASSEASGHHGGDLPHRRGLRIRAAFWCGFDG